MKVDNLYKKFKSYVYYNHNAIQLKSQLARYESENDFPDKLKELWEILTNLESNMPKIEKLIDEIDYSIIPKKFNNENPDSNSISNVFDKEKYHIDTLNVLFKGPIELHLISFYWILKYGVKLQKSYKKYNYANILYEKAARINNKSSKSFVPYFNQYNLWRDEGINKAHEAYKRNATSAILMLDISSYYYSVDFDFQVLEDLFKSELDKEKFNRYQELTSIIKKIFVKYNRVIFQNVNKINSTLKVSENQITLPIGLAVSNIFANFYLKELDEKIANEIRPLYYGRYVDDIMIVLPESSLAGLNKYSVTTKEFINGSLIYKTNIVEMSSKEELYYIRDDKFDFKFKDKMTIQNEKIKLFLLDKNGTDALLKKFKNNLRKNSSEFRYLPSESKIISEFYDESYSMLYNDTHNKIRSVDKFEGNQFGLSKYLAKIIMISKYWNDDSNNLNIVIDQIGNYFSGINAIKFYTLWNKIFVFYIVNDKYKLINEFYANSLEKINQISVKNRGKSNAVKVKKYLKDYLKYSLYEAIALNLETIDKIDIDKRINEEEIKKNSKHLKNSNLFRNGYLINPLISYMNGSDKINNFLTLSLRCSKDYSSSDECNNCENCELELNDNKIKLSPRYIHYHEILQHKSYLEAYRWSDNEGFHYMQNNNYFELSKYFKNSIIPINMKNQDEINNIIFDCKEKLDDLKIGIASMKVNSKNIEKSYLKSPNLSRKRFNSLIKLMNYIEKSKCDVIVLPEVSIPYAWTSILAKYAKNQRKVLIFGVEHIISRNNYALNMLATFIPFKTDGYNNLATIYRVKNHYSPEEERLLKGYRYKIPRKTKSKYNLINWKGIRFSSFNCYEFADIKHRALMRSKVDFLTASEYNRDINYFSNIVESISRDVHCYVVQSNSSDFGDSRITRPSKTYLKDIVKLKGGIHDQVVVGEIDILKLREFQLKEYELQKNDEIFKPTPPNFDKKEIEKILAGER